MSFLERFSLGKKGADQANERKHENVPFRGIEDGRTLDPEVDEYVSMEDFRAEVMAHPELRRLDLTKLTKIDRLVWERAHNGSLIREDQWAKYYADVTREQEGSSSRQALYNYLWKIHSEDKFKTPENE